MGTPNHCKSQPKSERSLQFQHRSEIDNGGDVLGRQQQVQVDDGLLGARKIENDCARIAPLRAS